MKNLAGDRCLTITTIDAAGAQQNSPAPAGPGAADSGYSEPGLPTGESSPEGELGRTAGAGEDSSLPDRYQEAIASRFAAGEAIRELKLDYGMSERIVLRAIRKTLGYLLDVHPGLNVAKHELDRIRSRLVDITDDLLGLQPPETDSVALLDALEKRCNEWRIDAGKVACLTESYEVTATNAQTLATEVVDLRAELLAVDRMLGISRAPESVASRIEWRAVVLRSFQGMGEQYLSEIDRLNAQWAKHEEICSSNLDNEDPATEADRLNPYKRQWIKQELPTEPLALFLHGIRYYAGMLEDDDNWSHSLGHIESCCRDFQKAIDERSASHRRLPVLARFTCPACGSACARIELRSGAESVPPSLCSVRADGSVCCSHLSVQQSAAALFPLGNEDDERAAHGRPPRTSSPSENIAPVRMSDCTACNRSGWQAGRIVCPVCKGHN